MTTRMDESTREFWREVIKTLGLMLAGFAMFVALVPFIMWIVGSPAKAHGNDALYMKAIACLTASGQINGYSKGTGVPWGKAYNYANAWYEKLHCDEMHVDNR